MTWLVPLILLVGLLTGCESTGRSVSSSASEEGAPETILPPIVEHVEEAKVLEPEFEEPEVVPPLSELIEKEIEPKKEASQESSKPLLEELPPEKSKAAMAQSSVSQLPPSRSAPKVPAVSEPRQATPAKPVQPKMLQDVYFPLDQATILNAAKLILEDNALLLKTRHKDKRLLLEGHCDERGSVEYNLILGVRRAQVVKSYLVDLGISPARIRIVSYGKERPVCSQQQEACWQKNRRTHFVFP